jgi:hypothetical protein
MLSKNFLSLFIAFYLIGNFAFAQQTPVKADSSAIYRDIESYSKRSGFNKFIYQLIFKPFDEKSKGGKSKKKTYKKLIQKPYSAFEGKIIRHIYIETLDPFGYTISDTSESTQNSLIRTGNMLHVKSRHLTIRNLLLIRQNQPFDSLLVKESERLVRSYGYVQDVSFFVKVTGSKSDSVDIFILELDKWSIIPGIAISPSRVSVKLTDKNFAGFGHEFQNDFTWYHTTGQNSYNTKYYIPNINNTYINTTLHYGKDESGNSTKLLAVDRPFFSPFAKWAAGVKFTQQFQNISFRTPESLIIYQQYKFNSQDYWGGSAIRIFKGNTENERTTNLISTLRFLRIRYFEKPNETVGSPNVYNDENFYLAGIGISARRYVQDKYIFNYGVTEDVPIGKVYSLTGGYQEYNNTGRVYIGARISSGNYYEWGYLGPEFEYGTFLQSSKVRQGVLIAEVNYFTGLIEIGQWKFRQFAKPQLTLGFNRFVYDSLTLHDENGLNGFNSSELTGTKRMLLTLQTQSYGPWNIIGFHFGPFFNYSMGMLGDEQSGFSNSKLYSQIGLGVLIKNENLVFGTFQLSVSFYPSIPGNGNNIFKANTIKTTDFGFRDFEIGKPETISLQ